MTSDLQIGELDRYRLERKIGSGGMGVVYAARQMPLDRPVAIKLIHPHLTAARTDLEDRFVREAASLSRIAHPSIVTILDYGRTNAGRLYIAMEFIDGQSLANVIGTEGPFSFSRVLRIALRLSRALSRAHHAGVIHRDLKPENIMLLNTTEEDDHDQLKVLDFGLAKLFGPGADASSLSDTGGGPMLGSPRYSSPEQIQGGLIDPRTDIYAVGVILYVMASGTVPFDGGTPADVARQHLTVDPPPLYSVGYQRECPPALERVILRCLAKRPEDRYETMADLINDIKDTFKAIASSLADRLPSGIGDALPRMGSMTSHSGGDTLPSFPPTTSNGLASVPPLVSATPLPSSPSATPLPAPPMPGTSYPPGAVAASTSIPAAFVTPLPSYAPPPDQNKTWRILAVVLALGLSAAVGALLTLNRSEPNRLESVTAPAVPATPAVPIPEVAKEAIVRITTNPPGATVRHQNREYGRTPTALRLPMAAKIASIQLELDGYETTRTEVVLDAQSVNVSLELIPIDRKKRGRRTRRAKRAAIAEPTPDIKPPPVKSPIEDLDLPAAPGTVDRETSKIPVLEDESKVEILD